MNKEIRGVIFDLDGVLCSTDMYHFRAWKELSEELGIPCDESIRDRVRGISRMASLDIVLGDKKDSFTEEEKVALATKKNDRYRAMLSEMRPCDRAEGAEHLLSFLTEHGIMKAIGSSSRNTRFILEKIDLLAPFDAIADGTMITKSKPDPEVFLKAAGMLGLEPSECLVVEDAWMGIEAAVRGGFVPVAIGEEAHRHEKAEYRIRKLSEIEELFK